MKKTMKGVIFRNDAGDEHILYLPKIEEILAQNAQGYKLIGERDFTAEMPDRDFFATAKLTIKEDNTNA